MTPTAAIGPPPSGPSPGSKHLVIGAGPVGLGVARALRQYSLPYDQVDAGDGVGGLWRRGVYPNVHLISTTRTTAYDDFPMTGDHGDFPAAEHVLAYFESFADHYGLRSDIELQRKVSSVDPLDDGRWHVDFADGERRTYHGVIVCTGHHWWPRHPELPGDYTGTYFHSSDYTDESVFADKRVLVIGGGNSGCDIASDAARSARSVHMSLRSPSWFLPKTLYGRPTTEILSPHTPIAYQSLLLRALTRIAVGPYEQYGLPRPDHGLFDKQPTFSDLIFHHIRHGRLRIVPSIERVENERVSFSNGFEQDFDVIVAATGFDLSYPFLPDGLVDLRDGVPQIPAGTMHHRHRGLYLVGWTQVYYGVGPLVSLGAPVVCEAIRAQEKMQRPVGAVLRRLGQKPPASASMHPRAAAAEYRRAMRWIPRLPKLEARLYRRRRTPVLPRPTPPAESAA